MSGDSEKASQQDSPSRPESPLCMHHLPPCLTPELLTTLVLKVIVNVSDFLTKPTHKLVLKNALNVLRHQDSAVIELSQASPAPIVSEPEEFRIHGTRPEDDIANKQPEGLDTNAVNLQDKPVLLTRSVETQTEGHSYSSIAIQTSLSAKTVEDACTETAVNPFSVIMVEPPESPSSYHHKYPSRIHRSRLVDKHKLHRPREIPLSPKSNSEAMCDPRISARLVTDPKSTSATKESMCDPRISIRLVTDFKSVSATKEAMCDPRISARLVTDSKCMSATKEARCDPRISARLFTDSKSMSATKEAVTSLTKEDLSLRKRKPSEDAPSSKVIKTHVPFASVPPRVKKKAIDDNFIDEVMENMKKYIEENGGGYINSKGDQSNDMLLELATQFCALNSKTNSSMPPKLNVEYSPQDMDIEEGSSPIQDGTVSSVPVLHDPLTLIPLPPDDPPPIPPPPDSPAPTPPLPDSSAPIPPLPGSPAPTPPFPDSSAPFPPPPGHPPSFFEPVHQPLPNMPHPSSHDPPLLPRPFPSSSIHRVNLPLHQEPSNYFTIQQQYPSSTACYHRYAVPTQPIFANQMLARPQPLPFAYGGPSQQFQSYQSFTHFISN